MDEKDLKMCCGSEKDNLTNIHDGSTDASSQNGMGVPKDN